MYTAMYALCLHLRAQILPRCECMHASASKTKAGSGHPTNFYLFPRIMFLIFSNSTRENWFILFLCTSCGAIRATGSAVRLTSSESCASYRKGRDAVAPVVLAQQTTVNAVKTHDRIIHRIPNDCHIKEVHFLVLFSSVY